jgi:SAM-dependent methyltransferase
MPGLWQGFDQALRRVTASVRRRANVRGNRPPPLGGYSENRHSILHVDSLSDDDLSRLNQLLPWKAFTVDRHGRRFGGVAWLGKRDQPEPVPDRRTLLLDQRFGLADKHVLEFGCFEGIHTVGLMQFASRLTAVDGRIENVAKTIVRTAMYGYHPTVFVHDVESVPPDYSQLEADVLHHVGVLYHLRDPVRHLLEIGRYIRLGLMLDTHYALDAEARLTYSVNGREYPYKVFQEQGRADVFSGLGSSSKWLPLGVLTDLLRQSGFSEIELVETRQERNGPRVLLIARRQ